MLLYTKYLSIHLKSLMQHKASFFMLALSQFLTSFCAFYASVYVLMSRYNTVSGFSFSEVSLCFAIVMLAFAFAEMIARGFDSFASMLGNGQFDRIMLRPRSPVFQVLSTKFEFTRVGRLMLAAVIMAWAISISEIQWTGGKIFTMLLMILCGTLIFSGLFMLYAGICFFTTEGLEFMNIFTQGGREFGKYPFSVYGKTVLRILTYIVPLAMFQYYPLLYITGKSDKLLHMLAPLAGLVFLLPCYAIWKIGLRRYKSTGS